MARNKKKVNVGNPLKEVKMSPKIILSFFVLFFILYTCFFSGEPCSDERGEVQWQTHRYGDRSGATTYETRKAVKVLFKCMDRNADYYKSNPNDANAACAIGGGYCYTDNNEPFMPLTVIGGALKWNNGNWSVR